MNKKFIALVSAGVIGAAGFSLQANAASSVSGNAAAKIAGSLDISESTALNFGGIDGAAGTVVINPSTGAATFTGTAAVDSGATRGVFSVTGDASASYAVTVDSSFNITQGATNIPVSSVTAVQANGGTLNGSGNDTVYVGGTLTVAGTETNGSYSGTYNISVAYN